MVDELSMGAIAAAMPDVADNADMKWDERQIFPLFRNLVSISQQLVVQESFVGATPRMRELEALRISVLDLYERSRSEGITKNIMAQVHHVMTQMTRECRTSNVYAAFGGFATDFNVFEKGVYISRWRFQTFLISPLFREDFQFD